MERIELPGGAVLHREGGGDRVPVLFLHGVGGGAWSWTPQAAALGSERPVYRFEARGHGAAARVADAGLVDHEADARDALARIVAREGRAALVAGHSMGGFLALALAAELPASVAALFLVDPVYAPSPAPTLPAPLRAVVLALVAPLVADVARGGPLARAIGRAMFVASFADRAEARRWWPHQRAQIPFEHRTMVREGIAGVERWPFAAFAPRVTAPTTLINGRAPALRSALRAALGDRLTEVTIPGGHYLQLDRPDAVTERLRAAAVEADAT